MVERSSIKLSNKKNVKIEEPCSSEYISLDKVFEMMISGMKLEVLEGGDCYYCGTTEEYGIIREHVNTDEYSENITTLLDFDEVVELVNMFARNIKIEAQ